MLLSLYVGQQVSQSNQVRAGEGGIPGGDGGRRHLEGDSSLLVLTVMAVFRNSLSLYPFEKTFKTFNI